MDFKSKSYAIDVTIDGVKYSLKQPLMKERLELESSDKSLNTKIVDWMVSLGLPLEVIEKLDEETFFEIAAYVNNPKKK